MKSEDVLQWTKGVMSDRTGETLTEIEKAILTGVWEGKKYRQIAEEFYCSESEVKKEAAKLWDKLRADLGEDLKKSNFRYKLEKKYKISQVSKSGDCILQEIDIVDINVCGRFVSNIVDRSDKSPFNAAKNQSTEPIIDIADAPEISHFHNRISELSTLKHWILEEQTRLITIYGLSGIGKSAIALKLVQEIHAEFDYIIWRNLSGVLSLEALQTDLQETFARSQPAPVPKIMDYLRNFRCLLILDDVQNLFEPGELAGHLTNHKNYGQFWKKIAKTPHRSCLILLSGEKPRSIATLEAENQPVRTLHLKGLGTDAEELLRDKGLVNEQEWPVLISRYQGHPSWLMTIAATILELFDGRVSQFLDDEDEIFLGDIEFILDAHAERLSLLEQQVLSWIISQGNTVDITQTHTSPFSKSQLSRAMQSLARRGLVEKISEQEKGESLRSHFQLNLLFAGYWQDLHNRTKEAR
ncbi:NB-ARC domain-containing protein [Roseofilum casamattae]|uniref:NB-ARC domain-containing protein n=1 Tax=Roseofilum casamattae BLCC-M143 TaxID=3022442 RepID=A0ABT7BVK0_9CYAN|nr:NB-ARC domain-containing protein [Roseofilum casamattae]MDJ1183211.1 NB-ARC domain-containing protein [Roseofilum casamattae BLCC-M143]